MIKVILGILLMGFVTIAIGQDDPLKPAQQRTPIFIGPVIGYNAVTHTTNSPVLPPAANSGQTDCPSFSNGSASGFYVGVSGEYLIGGNKDSQSSIIVKLLYNTMPTFMEAGGVDLPANVPKVTDPNGNNIVQQKINFTNDIDYQFISLEAYYKFNIAGTPLGVVAGFDLGFVLAGSQTQKMSLVKTPDTENITFEPVNFTAEGGPTYDDLWFYENGNTSLVFVDGEEFVDLNPIRIGIKIGVQYEFKLKTHLLIPHVYYNLGLIQFSNNDNYSDWRVHALQVGIDYRIPWKL